MEEFTTHNKANYYSGIASIMVNGKRAYELKGKFLDDLRDNAFSETNGEDVVEHTEYFLKIVDPINLPNVNYEQLRLSVFPISLVGNASEWFEEFKAIRDPSNSTFEKWLASKFANHMILDPFTKKVLWDFWIKRYDQERVADEEFFDAEEANNDDEQETAEIFRIETNLTKTYEDYENELNYELEEPWSEDGVPYEIYKEEHKDKDKHGLFNDHDVSVCKIRRFEMIKYSFSDDEEYVAIKEHEYDDLTSTNKDACRTYQEIFRRMDEAWMVNRAE
ncbi:hypothetical protein Tco_0967220 [Tanacetum coccineum]